MIFDRPTATTESGSSLQEGLSVGHKRAAVTGIDPYGKKKVVFEKRERARV